MSSSGEKFAKKRVLVTIAAIYQPWTVKRTHFISPEDALEANFVLNLASKNRRTHNQKASQNERGGFLQV